MLFISSSELFLFSRYLNLTFWSCREKGLIKKGEVNFEIHDLTAWLTNNHNTHIAQYLTN